MTVSVTHSSFVVPTPDFPVLVRADTLMHSGAPMSSMPSMAQIDSLQALMSRVMALFMKLLDKLRDTQMRSAAEAKVHRWAHLVEQWQCSLHEADLKKEGSLRQAAFQAAGGCLQMAVGGAGIGLTLRASTDAAHATARLVTEAGGSFARGADGGLQAGGTIEHARHDRDAANKSVEALFRRDASEGLSTDGRTAGDAANRMLDAAVDAARMLMDLCNRLNTALVPQR